MKKITAFILTVTLLLICSSSLADTKSGLFTYKLKGNGTAVITGFDWKTNGTNDIYIPRQIDGYTVSEVGAYSFSDDFADYQNTIGKSVVVVIPDTVTIIGEKAFFCTNINTVAIPSSVQSIGTGAFAGCENIKSHYVNQGNDTYTTINGVLYNKKTKELVSYPGLSAKTKIEIPNGIISIGDYAFYNVTFEEGISFPSTLTKIGKSAFEFATIEGGIKKIQYGMSFTDKDSFFKFSGVSEICAQAFKDARLTYIAFDFANSHIERIGDYAFSNVTLTNSKNFHEEWDLILPSSLTMLGEGAFNKYLSDSPTIKGVIGIIDLSETKITEIPAHTFEGIGLIEGRETGYRTPNIREIKLPLSLQSIGSYSFAEIGLIRDTLYGNTFYDVALIIPENVNKIRDHAFCFSGLDLSFADGSKIKAIEDSAFQNACIFAKDNKLELPNGIESIGSNTFVSHKIEVLSIPQTVTSIGEMVCNRSKVKLEVVPGSYAALYASENGYLTTGNEDTSWLDD